MIASQGRLTKNGKRTKFRHGGIRRFKLADLQPAPENDRLYRRPDPSDPEIIELAKSIKQYGIKEPLVISKDKYILSGHRRHCAARLAGRKTVPCRVENITRSKSPDRFLTLLREHNRQRDKTLDEKINEEIVSANPDEAYASLIEHREEKAHLNGDGEIELKKYKARPKMSAAKMPLLQAVMVVLEKLRDFWPVSVRKVHYDLLNDPPLCHASKPNSVYRNDNDSWDKCIDICARGRLEGYIPWEAIGDETRPVVTWNVHQDPRTFMRREIDRFGKGYWRALQQSQPHHIEILGEKNTLIPILKPIAMEYCIPLTTGRGFCSLPPRRAMQERFDKSGKDDLVLLIVSDFDPAGETIAESFARSMRDDFDLDVHPIKVALTFQQTQEMDLPPALPAKEKTSTYKAFAEKYGDDTWEVEALDPDTLQDLLRDAIDSVLDTDAFNAELDAEKQDAVYLQGMRQKIHAALGGMDFQQEGDTP